MTILRLLILIFSLAIGALLYIRHDIHQYDVRILSNAAELETVDWERPRVAIVFGASVLGNRVLSPVLADRVKTAIDLYQAGKVDQILVSGDNRHPSYNEPKAMYDYLVAHSIPARAILIDNSGRSTYETCLRARQVFGLRQAVLVSQGFHLPRALFIANELGLASIGMAGDLRLDNQFAYLNVREFAAEFKAWFNVRISPPAELKQLRKSTRRQPVGQALKNRWHPQS
ncbi:MAG: vancomycin high temperature exclusion protein [Acidobacteriota bacterium]